VKRVARKLLTALTTHETSSVTLTHSVAEETVRTLERQRFIEQAWVVRRTVETAQFLDVQRLMLLAKIYELTRKILPVFALEYRRTLVSTVYPPVQEQYLYVEKRVPYQQIAETETLRKHLTREDITRLQFENIILKPPYLIILDLTSLAELETNIRERYGLNVEKIVKQIIHMCKCRQSFLTVETGLKQLQMLLLELLVPFFHARPYTMNMLAVRVSPLTFQRLYNEALTYYIYGVAQRELFKQKALTVACQNRRQETKLQASSSGCGMTRPVKFSQGFTEQFTGEEKIGIPKDIHGKEILWIALRYAYSIPYWIRRLIAHHTGMPENHRYALYFTVGVIPSRRKTWRKYERHFPEAQYLHYSVDKQVMKAIQLYRSFHRETYPERGVRRYRRRI